MRPSSVIPAALLLLSGSLGMAGQKPVQAPLVPQKDRKLAAAFQLPDSGHKPVGLSRYRGNVIVLDFWATECGGCKAEIPYLIEFANAYKSRGLVVLVNPFVRAQKVNYPILMGDDGISNLYKVREMPATYVIDRSGRIAATYIGVVDRKNIEANIQALLRE